MILFLYGEDTFRLRRHAREVREKFLQKFDASGLNLTQVKREGQKEMDEEALWQAARAYPFLAEKRMVFVEGLWANLKKPEQKELVKRLIALPSSTILVCLEELSQKEAEKNLLLAEAGTMNDLHVSYFPFLQGAQLEAWIKKEAESLGVSLAPGISRELALRIPADMWRLHQEIAKLAAYAKDGMVTMADIEELVRADVSSDIFGFLDALSARNSEKTFHLLTQEREAGSEDFHLFALLTRQARLLVASSLAASEHASSAKEDLVRLFKLHPFAAQKALAAARSIPLPIASAWHQMLFELDFALKRGLSPATAVDMACAALLHPLSLQKETHP